MKDVPIIQKEMECAEGMVHISDRQCMYDCMMQFLILIRAQRKRCSYEGSIDSRKSI